MHRRPLTIHIDATNVGGCLEPYRSGVVEAPLMGLPWVRLDTQLPHNPKIVGLVSAKKWRAAFVYVCALAYSGQHGTDGFIPESCLFLLHATKAEAAELVAAGLWKPVRGGWEINDWDEFQLSSDDTKKRRERAQQAAAARWRNAKQPNIRGI